MKSIEKILTMAAQAEVPVEMAADLAAMDEVTFLTEVEGVLAILERGELPEQGDVYVFAVIREQQRRRTELLEKRNVLENEIAEKQTIIAEKEQIIAALQRRHDDLQMQVNELKSFTKVRRNDPCPCGSGKKYKHCCGKS